MGEVSELSSDQLERYIQLRDDPWLFLKYAIFTKDEVDSVQPVKRYPAHFLYTKFIVRMWEKEKKIAIPKSRRMTVSWTCLALITHELLFFKGRSWAVTSKKEENARELVSRIEFMIQHIPPEVISPNLLPKMKRGGMQSSPPAIEFAETLSKVQGFPQGGNQLRQYGFSGIFEDECAFQEESEDTYAAAIPTIRGGGRFIKVSSRAIEDGGFFKKIVFDKLDATDIRFADVPPVPAQTPMEGILCWKNPGNGFFVIDLHYTANPAKRSVEFREAIRAELPIRKYEMEFEKSWTTYAGKAVYQDFSSSAHITQTKPKLHVGLPVLLGWDSSGLTPACVIGQMQEETLVVMREIVGEGMGATRFVPHVVSLLAQHYPQITDISAQTISFFDPAGFKKNEITEETYLQHMIAGGFTNIKPGPMTWKKRVEAVVSFLTGFKHGKTSFLIYEQDCPTLVAGLKGGFRYPDKISEAEPDKVKPIKDIHSHPNDALQYMCGGLRSYRSENYNIEIPTPKYSFQRHNEKRIAK
jgi:hypothetical protein